MFALRRRSWLLSLAALTTMSGCIPYTVGHTARPARKREVKVTTSLFMVDKNKESYSPPEGWNYVGVDLEGRAGLTDRTDVGLRVVSANGFVLSAMRRMNGTSEDPGPSLSVKLGAGMVDFPGFGIVEASVLASGDEIGRVTPYGALRVVQLIPTETSYPHDSPTAGATFGMRIGSATFGISPEVGLFYDKPWPGVKRNNFLIVPSVSIHGNPLGWLRELSRRMGR